MTNELRMPIVRSPKEWPVFVWIVIIAGIFVLWTAWQSAGANQAIREKQAEIDLWTEKIEEIIDQKKRDDANLLAENEALAIAKDREAQFRAQERTRRIQAEQENRRLRTARDEAVVESLPIETGCSRFSLTVTKSPSSYSGSITSWIGKRPRVSRRPCRRLSSIVSC